MKAPLRRPGRSARSYRHSGLSPATGCRLTDTDVLIPIESRGPTMGVRPDHRSGGAVAATGLAPTGNGEQR